MFNHGTVTAMLFLLVGVIYDRAHHRDIDGFGGLASVMPVYTGVTAVAFFAALGLPGLSAFISEVLVLLGAWQRYPGLTVIGAHGGDPDGRLHAVDAAARLARQGEREVRRHRRRSTGASCSRWCRWR